MKTTMIKIKGYRLWVLGLLALLPALAEAVDYQNTHQPSETFVPAVEFQSTSAFSEQWRNTEDNHWRLNVDGSVDESAYLSSQDNRPKVRKNGTGTPGFPEDENQQPLGDGLWALLLLALGYLVMRRRRAARP